MGFKNGYEKRQFERQVKVEEIKHALIQKYEYDDESYAQLCQWCLFFLYHQKTEVRNMNHFDDFEELVFHPLDMFKHTDNERNYLICDVAEWLLKTATNKIRHKMMVEEINNPDIIFGSPSKKEA